MQLRVDDVLRFHLRFAAKSYRRACLASAHATVQGVAVWQAGRKSQPRCVEALLAPCQARRGTLRLDFAHTSGL